MGKKGKWFGVVRRVFSPDPKEKRTKEQKTEKLKPVDLFPASTSEIGNAVSGASQVPVIDAELVESTEYELREDMASAATASDVAVIDTAEITQPVVSKSRFHGKSREEAAVVVIQTAFRGYQARRALRALKGLVRLKLLVDGDAAKRQVTTTLRCMQTLSRVQSQIQSRRIRLTEEKQALQRLRREQELEALKASIGDEWDDSPQSKEQLDASLMSKHEAAIRRERAMAYAFSHQRKNTLKSGYPLFTDLNNPHWDWSCLDRWTAGKPLETASVPAEKEPSTELASVKSSSLGGGGDISNAYARRDAVAEKQSPGIQKFSRSANRQAPPTPPLKTSTFGKTTKQESRNDGQITSEDDDSRSILSLRSEPNRRHSLPGSIAKDDENLTSFPNTPNFMTPTRSARLKSRLHSPLNENTETPENHPITSAKKRLSLSKADKHSVLSSPARARRHSGPPKVNVSPAKVVHVDSALDSTEGV